MFSYAPDQLEDLQQTLNGESEVDNSRLTLNEPTGYRLVPSDVLETSSAGPSQPNRSSTYNELAQVLPEMGVSADPAYGDPTSGVHKTSLPESFESTPAQGLKHLKSTITEAEAQEEDKSAKHWIRWCLLAVVTALAISLPVGWALRVQDFTVNTPTKDATLELFGNLVSIDPVAQVMTLDWVIQANCGVDTNITCVDDDIHFDQSLLQTPTGRKAPIPSNGRPTPTFNFIAASMNNETLRIYGSSLFFRTQVVTFSKTAGFKGTTLQAYPFDTYGAVIFIFTNRTTIDIAQVNGIAPGFSVTIDRNSTVNDPSLTGVQLTMNISRGAVVQLYTISILVAIWLVTLTLLAATVSIVILGRKMAKEVLAIPVGTLFAFTSLRGTLPGAPQGFGAIIDFMAILPCLAILTFCAVFMLCVYVFGRDPLSSRRPLWHGPVKSFKAKFS